MTSKTSPDLMRHFARFVFVASVTISAFSLLIVPSAQAKNPSAKVEICHIPPGNPENFHSIQISEKALASHLSHGDLTGPCFQNEETICDDGNICTVDAMDPETETCLNDQPPVDCNDGNLCTFDECLPESGCVSSPISCGDGDLCTVDTCNEFNGTCENTQKSCDPNVCDPNSGECGDVCSGYICDPDDECHDAGECSVDSGSADCSEGLPKSDGSACTNGTCQSGICEPSDLCSTVSCDTGYECNSENGQCEPSSCDTLTCNAAAECVPSGTPACVCLPGYEGDGSFCSDVNECLDVERCGANAQCFNTPGSFSCGCNDGYSGDGTNCSADACTAIPAGASYSGCSATASGSACEQSCVSNFTGDPVTHTCTAGLWDTTTGPVCTPCSAGWTGVDCADDINECDSGLDVCVANALCSNTTGGFSCTCAAGYEGAACTDINECAPGPLLACSSKYATCTNTPGSKDCEYGPAVVEEFTPEVISLRGGEIVDLQGQQLGINKADIMSIAFGPGGMACSNIVWYSEDHIHCSSLPGVVSDAGEWPILVTTYTHGGPGASVGKIVIIECQEEDRDCRGVCFGGWIPDGCGDCGGDGSAC